MKLRADQIKKIKKSALKYTLQLAQHFAMDSKFND